MENASLATLADEHLKIARQASSGRSAHTVYGGQEHILRQTLVALRSGTLMDEHENPGEATIQVLRGQVTINAGEANLTGSAGDLLIVPQAMHSLTAEDDSVILLTVAKHR